MKHTYHITGMTCNGCRTHVQEALEKVEGVTSAEVDLESGKANVESDHHIAVDVLKEAVAASGNYALHEDEHAHHPHPPKKKDTGPGIYYCPMRCEGDKTYDHPDNCPVCGMDLVKEAMSGEDLDNATFNDLRKKLLISLIFTIPVFIIAMGDMIPGKPLLNLFSHNIWNWIQLVLSIPVVFYTCWMFFQRAWSSIVRRSPNMFTLIGIGSGVAWLFSLVALIFPDIFPDQFKTADGHVHLYFESAVVILTLVLLGQMLEAGAHNRTNTALKALLNLAPNQATRVLEGKDKVVSIDDIKVGDIIKVKAGEKVPVDGIIVEGSASLDESMITGEPIPVDLEVNDQVRSGSINGNTTFLFKAEKVGAETLLSQIIDMVKNASRSRAPVQDLADKISTYFVPIIVGISVLTFAVWAIWGPEPAYVYAFVNAIAVLIIACPCALGLATPMSVMVGIGKGAQEGILIKDAKALQELQKINYLIIDKTGTLTEGKPSIQSVSDSKSLQLAASLNSNSNHPLAKAIVEYAAENKVELLPTSAFENVTGKGVKGVVGDQMILVGNAKFMSDELILFPLDIKSKVEEEEAKGHTISLVAEKNKVIGYCVITDAIKQSSKKAIQEIKDKGIKIVLMTGDNEIAAQQVAKEVGIDEYQARCLPQDKLEKVKALQAKGGIVAMAGDGINDAPALAQADIGIAMDTGTDIAIESSDITLMKGDLNGIVKALNLGRSVMGNIRQNLFFALVYNSLGVPLAAGILFPFFDVLLSPMIAAVAMSFSSVSVIANALRLKTARI